MKCYSELIQFPTFKERFEYLRFKRPAYLGITKFRYLNQRFYSSEEWKRVCREVVARDYGCDLAISGRSIFGRPIVHHILPIEMEDLEKGSRKLIDVENLITVSFNTHNAIHFGNVGALITDYEPRRLNDTCPWKEGANGY